MKKIYVIRKYVVAINIQEALKLERKTLLDDIWLEDTTQKQYMEDILGRK